jgi:phage gp29-like protein
MKLPKANELTDERVQLALRARFNPTGTITPHGLAAAHDEFDRGYLRNAAMMWEVIEDRDDLVKSVAGKRKKNIARNGFEVVTFAKEGAKDYAQALKQKAALEYFYGQVRVTNAIDANESGGFKLLIRQMMDAVGKKYAVHEILWKPTEDGLTAELRFVPLWFFENTKGRLRFLKSPYALEGVDMAPGAWLVTAADGIMKACATAWMRKHLALSDWESYSGTYGKPGLVGTTSAARGSAEFDSLASAMEEFVTNKTIVLNNAETVKIVDFASNNAPFDQLVERMDRLISALWRGSDLSTISKTQGYGASLQQGETQILEEDDAELISETLQKNIDPVVIEYTFGKGTPLLAGVMVQQTPKRGTQQDMIIDQFLVGAGMQLSVADAAKRYGRAIADPGEPVLKIAPKEDPWWRPGWEPKAGSENLSPMNNVPGSGNQSDRPS